MVDPDPLKCVVIQSSVLAWFLCSEVFYSYVINV